MILVALLDTYQPEQPMGILSTRVYYLSFSSFLVLLLLTPLSVQAQETRTLDVGQTYYRTGAAFMSDNLHWPRGVPHVQSNMTQFYGVVIGAKMNWTDDAGGDHDVKIAQIQGANYSDIEKVTVPVPGAFKRVYRNPYPQRVIDGEDMTNVKAKGDPVDPSIPSDGMIYTKLKTWTDIDIERWAYGFSGDKNGDFIVLEYRFTNTADQKREGVYFSLPVELATRATQPKDLWTDYYGADYQQYVAGDAEADSLRMHYSWDGNLKALSQDTKGNPNKIWGNFQKPQYYGAVVLHADRSSTDETDSPAQPSKAGWTDWDYDINMNESTHEDTYGILSGPWPRAMPSTYSRMVNAQGEEVDAGKYRELRPGIDVRNYDTSIELAKTSVNSFGPYEIGPGEDVRIVMAFVGGSIPPRLAIDAGRAYENGFSEQRDLVPLPYDVKDPTTGELLAQKGDLLSKNQKDAILDTGKDRLFQEADRVIDIWNSSDVRYGKGTFDVELAPATPSLTGTSLNEKIRLEWGNEAENDSRVGQIAGYRIYRNYQRPKSISLPTDTTFVLLDEVGPDVREYVDTEVVVGEDYYYYVTAVTEDGRESSRFMNRTGTSAERVREVLRPTRGPEKNWQQNVTVVPNPYHVQAAQKYAGKRLNFLNLPGYCNIHIFTEAGDRVRTVYHNSNTGDEGWQRQDTFTTMEIVSGVYFYVIEELDGPRGAPTGRMAQGKFVVIK